MSDAPDERTLGMPCSRTRPIAIVLLLLMIGCKHENVSDPTDELLLELAQRTGGATWFNESDTLLPRTGGSGHAQPLLRTRYNTIASTALTDEGRVVADTIFPTGSVIVKELWENHSVLSLYALMYKKPDHPYADTDGWVWGYVQPDGTVVQPASDKGSACRGCHSGAGHIDLTRMNIAYP